VPELEAKVDDRELKMAHFLIDSMSEHFQPEKYTDTYRAELEQLIQAKIEGGTVPAAAPAKNGKAKGEVVDLMEVLRRSVDAAKSARAPAPKPEPEPAKRSRSRVKQAA
jgi:DNA end-binding protein Ku